MEEAIEDRYVRYLSMITLEMTDEDSFRQGQEDELDDMFNKFSFDNVSIGEVKAKTNVAQTQYINQYATSGAIELIKEEKRSQLIEAQIKEVEAKILLIQAQTDQAEKQALLIDAQKALIDRQEDGYDDNLIVKAGEFQGGLASFAVNANSDDAQSAIDNFNTTILELKARA